VRIIPKISGKARKILTTDFRRLTRIFIQEILWVEFFWFINVEKTGREGYIIGAEEHL
jgi:hypothetical protein